MAAKAIEMPKTIWMSLRKPPLASPKASVRPVIAIASTAMIWADRARDGIENDLQRCFPGHARAGCVRGACGQQTEQNDGRPPGETGSRFLVEGLERHGMTP